MTTGRRAGRRGERGLVGLFIGLLFGIFVFGQLVRSSSPGC
jgi:hypothetical protein